MPFPLGPWRHPGLLWRAASHVALTPLVNGITFAITIALFSVTAGLLITFLVALPFAWLLFTVSEWFGRVERARIAALMDVSIRNPVTPPTQSGWLRRIGERAASGARWKEIAHHLLGFPVGMIAYALTAAAWCGSLILAALPLYVDALPGGTAKFYFFEIGRDGGAFLACAVGLAGLAVVAPWVTIGAARVTVGLATWLLGPRREEELAAEVTRLETVRSAAVDSAEAERRRIERDLHDGAQQRLVALAADLGAAREKLEDDPDAAKHMVAGAHEEAKAALKEIRDLVRGIHPVILEDRGLDAALSAVVARSPVPVSLDVRVTPRPGPALESAAYFVVNEALTNVARHAHATEAHVAIVRAGDRLVIEVRDDGVGGADASLGTGLQGLRDRVSGLNGAMYVVSPPGGPTTLTVELPCAS